MEGQGTKELRERIKLFFDNNLKAFIIDNKDNYYFCDIKELNDVIVKVKNFAGKRAGQIDELLLFDIKEIKLYRDRQ
jgi:hypothetical protein